LEYLKLESSARDNDEDQQKQNLGKQQAEAIGLKRSSHGNTMT